jgi:hypothetical protein
MTTALEDKLAAAMRDILGNEAGHQDCGEPGCPDCKHWQDGEAALRAYAEAPEPGELVAEVRDISTLGYVTTHVARVCRNAADRLEALERDRDGVLEEAAARCDWLAGEFKKINDAVQGACTDKENLMAEMQIMGCIKSAQNIRALKSPAHPRSDGWRTMESAPKDGEQVIFYCPAPAIFIAPSSPEQSLTTKQAVKMIAAGADWPNMKWNPTHWRPLPPPPNAGDR